MASNFKPAENSEQRAVSTCSTSDQESIFKVGIAFDQWKKENRKIVILAADVSSIALVSEIDGSIDLHTGSAQIIKPFQ